MYHVQKNSHYSLENLSIYYRELVLKINVKNMSKNYKPSLSIRKLRAFARRVALHLKASARYSSYRVKQVKCTNSSIISEIILMQYTFYKKKNEQYENSELQWKTDLTKKSFLYTLHVPKWSVILCVVIVVSWLATEFYLRFLGRCLGLRRLLCRRVILKDCPRLSRTTMTSL